jgi:hypothetical protein
MKKRSFVIALSIAAAFAAAPAVADSTLVKFDGGIGVIPVSNVAVDAAGVVTVSRNVVRGVSPAGQIWVIRELKADVKGDGSIRVDGRGLLLGGGNNIAGNANARVFATLICEAAAPFIERSTTLAGVALEPDGDFKIDDVLTPVATECASPVLLIRNAANLGWFAAGIPRR